MIALDGRDAEVEAFGQRRRVNVALMDEPLAVGDYVLVRAGGYAIARVDEAQAGETLALFAADGVEAAFRRIEHERMDDVPMLNRALRVEAVGFEPWEGHWLGALISPWFVNLVIVRGAVDGWDDAPEDEAVIHRFPCGSLAFLGAFEPEVGHFRTCALTTAMHAFASQEQAREFAVAALAGLKRAPAPAEEPRREAIAGPMSKRRFLGALFLVC